MSIVYRTTFFISFLLTIILAIFIYGLYLNEKKILYEREKTRQETIVNSFYKVITESILSEDDFSLINYTFKLKDNYGLKEAFVYDGEKYLSHTEKTLVRKKENISQNNEFNDISYLKTIEIRQKTYIAKISFSKEKIDTQINSTLQNTIRQILQLSIIVFFVGIIGSYILSIKITGPIREVSNAAKEVAKGNLNSQIKISQMRNTQDEIEILKMEFNKMINKLKELDEMKKDFISAITHELKSPIASIDSYTEILEREISKNINENSNKWLTDISCIKQNLNRLSYLISDLLDAAKIEKGDFTISKQKHNFKELIESLIQYFKPEAEKLNIKLNFNYDFPIMEIEIDQERMNQVFSNLISNALKYTPSGGKINIKVSDYKIGNTHYDNLMLVSVQDTGLGIPSQAQEEIFEKFKQLKTNISGKPKMGRNVGLGLYIVKNIIEKHEGKIWVESELNKGSIFKFILPC